MRARGSLRDALRISEYVKGEFDHPDHLRFQQARVQSSASLPCCMPRPKGKLARELWVQAPSIASNRPAQRSV